MKALAEQEIQWRKGHTLIAQLLSAGEFPIGLVYAHAIDFMQKAGAPVDWVDTVDPVVALASRLAVSAKPAHPNAAKLFVDFVLSKEGQEIARSAGRIPVRRDVEPLSPKMDSTKLKLKVAPDWSSQSTEYVEEFRTHFRSIKAAPEPRDAVENLLRLLDTPPAICGLSLQERDKTRAERRRRSILMNRDVQTPFDSKVRNLERL